MHTTTKDVEIEGYKIRKGQLFTANLTKFMKDPKVFPEPKRLMPERFIQDEVDDVSSHGKLKVLLALIETILVT